MRRLWTAVVMALFCILFLALTGRTYTATIPYMMNELPPGELYVTTEARGGYEGEVVRIEDYEMIGHDIKVKLSAVAEGSVYIVAMKGESMLNMARINVLPLHIITFEEYLGDCTGDLIIPLMLCVYLIYLIIDLWYSYRDSRNKTIYSYRNVRLLGLLIFLGVLLFEQVLSIFRYGGFVTTLRITLNSAESFSIYAFPFVLIMSVYMVFSNLRLMKLEGRTWRNMLGVILGLLLILLTVSPMILEEYLQRSQYINVHNENGAALYVERGLEAAVSAMAAYLEAILIGTIVYGLKAARHIPSFDKDYILILGCQVASDGSLTKLLQGRADRAVEFAKMQKEAAGKDIIFVPSGGKGSDEPIAEADAICNYLLSQGISKEQILVENQSVNTYENFRNSFRLIQEHTDKEDPAVAFSTTNYHVFRSGVIAEEMGIHAEGIGAKTKRYFWINAFIREFAATLKSDLRKHLRAVLVIMGLMILMAAFMYFNVNL